MSKTNLKESLPLEILESNVGLSIDNLDNLNVYKYISNTPYFLPISMPLDSIIPLINPNPLLILKN